MRELRNIGNLTEVSIDLSRLPGLADIDPEKCYLSWSMQLATAKDMKVIEAAFARHFGSVDHIETAYCQYRLRRLGFSAAAGLAGTPLTRRLTAWLCRKLATMVMVCTKSPAA